MDRPQRWRKYGFWDTLNISPDGRKIIHKAKDFACQKLDLTVISAVKDKVGVWAYLLKDKKGREYFFVAKRYIYFMKDGRGIISMNKTIVDNCVDWGFYVLMYIEQGEYIYSFEGKQIKESAEKELLGGFINQFNRQTMYNWDIRKIGINMLPTRTQTIKPVAKSPLVKYIKMGTNVK